MSRSSRSTRTYLHLAAAMPVQIDSKRPDNVRMVLKRAAQGLLDAGVPILRSFAFERAQDGRWLIVFHRAKAPPQDYGTPTHPAAALAPAVLHLVDDIVSFTASPQSRPWFTHCVSTLGPESARFYFAQLKGSVLGAASRKPRRAPDEDLRRRRRPRKEAA
jgi:hypothetical protein